MEFDVFNAVLWALTGIPGVIYVFILIKSKNWHICGKVSAWVGLLIMAISIFLLISFPSVRISIQNKAVLTGAVYDQAGNTLGGARLNLADSPLPIITSYCVDWSGTGGNFILEAPRPGTYYINIQKENYQGDSIERTMERGAQQLNIHLSPLPEVAHEQVAQVEVTAEKVENPEISAQIEEAAISLFGTPDSKVPIVLVDIAFNNTGDYELVWKALDSWLLAETKDGRVVKLPFDYESTLFLDTPFQGYEIEMAPGTSLSGYIAFSLPPDTTVEDLVRIMGPSLAYEMPPTGISALLPSWINPPTEIRLNP